jgi:hypothetical protein
MNNENIKKFFLILFLSISFCPFKILAQSDNISLGSKELAFLNRLDILLQNDSILNFNTVKPVDRKSVTKQIEYIDSLDKAGKLSVQLTEIDRNSISRFLMDNATWTDHFKESFKSKNPVLHNFYRTPAHFYVVKDKILAMEIDPVLNLQYGQSNDGTGNTFTNTRGLLIRGSINKKVGFYSYLSDNQEKDPLYVRQFAAAYNAVPGVGFYKPYGKDGKAFDFFDFRGGISFTLAKYIHFQYAYDKLFIGNGVRSLFLSDFANNYLFLRLNTRLWKLKYEMVIAQTMQSVPQVQREMKAKNYMSLHHLSFQATKWLNLGLYENIMENGNNGLQLSYLNPLIFYRAAESNLGASGKASIGIDLKANIAHKFQFYSQLLINEFHIHEILHYSDGAFVNKQAIQAGVKYVNALGIKNLDLQLEANYIRPFTYTNYDSTTNFTHYNQPLAHPLGASVKEAIAVLNYHPLPKLYLTAKLISFEQGLDSSGVNMGSNIFRSYSTRTRDYSYFIGSGIPVHSTSAAFYASYEIFENAFFDFSASHRSYNVSNQTNSAVIFYNLGFRLNIQRREFNF